VGGIPVKQRDVLLVPFPFSDRSGAKVRPVLVLSNNAFNSSGEDLIVCGITTNIRPSKYSIGISQGDFESGEIRHECAIKVETILKLHNSLIIKKIGAVREKTFRMVYSALLDLFSQKLK